MRKHKFYPKIGKKFFLTAIILLLIINGFFWPLVYNKKYRIHTTSETTLEAIPFQTIRTDSASLNKGQSRIDTNGQQGQSQLNYEVKTKDGVVISKMLVNTLVIKQPIDERLSVGTYVAPAPTRNTYVPTYLPTYNYSPTTCSTQYHTYGGYFDPSATTTCY